MYIYAPKIIRFSVTGLLDPLRTFFLIFSLYILLKLVDRLKTADSIIFGFSLSMLSVSRGEGLLEALGFLLSLPCLYLLKKRRFSFSRMALVLCIAVFCFIIGLIPFCYGNWVFYHAFVPDIRFLPLPGSQSIQPIADAGGSPVSTPTPFWLHIVESLNCSLRGFYELYLVFTVWGMLCQIVQKKWNWEYTFFIGIYIAHTCLYIMTVSAYRYYIYLVPLFMPFTLSGLRSIWEKGRELIPQNIPLKIQKWGHLLFIAGITCVFLFQAVNGLSFSFDRKRCKKDLRMSAFLKERGKTVFPEKQRCRLAAFGNVETVYRSGMEAVFQYKNKLNETPDLHTCRNYDFLLLNYQQKLQEDQCPWLRKVNLPEELSRYFQLYEMKPEP